MDTTTDFHERRKRKVKYQGRPTCPLSALDRLNLRMLEPISSPEREVKEPREGKEDCILWYGEVGMDSSAGR
eukprot:CAMPEP_0173186266 /NCGR_PEP_ID=MMETSP1141-20130122/10038_1 /TAXON_ID=483371 /ORGANISM="non described non described, Strain CCMP2298" /LENGTH=71 /DNA_ID=CAMNT_0014109933 /DNA_START=793 /DNA_END=1008 /DNA_ORIENTATION=+